MNPAHELRRIAASLWPISGTLQVKMQKHLAIIYLTFTASVPGDGAEMAEAVAKAMADARQAIKLWEFKPHRVTNADGAVVSTPKGGGVVITARLGLSAPRTMTTYEYVRVAAQIERATGVEVKTLFK